MNRRGFLRAAGSLAVAAPIPAVVPVAAAAGSGVLAGSMGAAASGVTCAHEVALASMPLMRQLAWDAYHACDDLEYARKAWYLVYRAHRIMVRQGRARPEPAKLLWLREKRRRLQIALQEQRAGHSKRNGSGPGTQGAIARRVNYRRAQGRIRAALKLRGFARMPWEMAR